MRRRAALLAALLLGAACTRSSDADRVVLWHAYGGAEKAALEEVAAELGERGEVELQLVQVPYGAFVDKITNAVPRGNGPDLFIMAHDRIGDWAGEIAEPIEYYVDEELADHFAYDALAGLAWEGSLYGLPMAIKTVALFYRADLAPAPPATTEDLYDLARRLEERGAYALVYENTVPYYHAGWLHGFGGGDFFDGEGKLDLTTRSAARALEFARELREEGVVPRDTTARNVASLFNEGEAATAISGPWFAGDIEEDVPWAVAPMPVVSTTGERARPYHGIEGVIMSARARDKEAAFEVMRALTADDSALLRARRARQLVPNVAVYEDAELAGDPMLAAFRQQFERSVLMPATPEARQVWAPYETALQSVIRGGADPMHALERAEKEVLSYLQGADGR